MAKSIDIFLADFRVEVREDGTLVREITDLSLGRPGHLTPIFDKAGLAPRQAMHVSGAYPPPHGGAEMPFALFFDKPAQRDVAGTAFHQGDTFAASHGCVHLGRADAEWLFHWAGTAPVAASAHGPYPASPTRAHVYQIGASNMLARVILAINTRLAALGLLGKPADAAYDQQTADAVTRFQTANGLKPDGKIGPSETAPALGVKL